MKPLRILATVLLAITPAAFGQSMRGGQGNSANAKMAKLFGKTGGFTATAQSSTLETDGTETIIEMNYAVRDGMVRIERDLTKTKTMRKGKPVKKRDDDMEGMSGMGLNNLVTLVLPDKQATYLVYPSLKAYCEAPKTAATDDNSKTDWNELGKDTVDGHPCIKYLVTATKADGTTEESTAWKATDLKDFIIQTVIVSGGEATTLKYTNIKHEKPAAALFDLPADYKKYGSMQEMMMSSMQRMLQGAGGLGQ